MKNSKSEKTSEIKTFLQDLPQDTTLLWAETHESLYEGIHSASWCDIYQPELCQMLEWGWLWTINLPDETWEDWIVELGEEKPVLWFPKDSPERETRSGKIDLYNLGLPVDRIVYGVRDPEGLFDEMLEEPKTFVGFGEPIPEAKLEELEQYAEKHDTVIVSRVGWSTGAINKILTQWVQELTGRTDIVFKKDDTLLIPMIENLNKQTEALEHGDENVYMIGENISITGDALDTLLEMGVEQSAEIMAELNKVIQNIEKDAREQE